MHVYVTKCNACPFCNQHNDLKRCKLLNNKTLIHNTDEDVDEDCPLKKEAFVLDYLMKIDGVALTEEHTHKEVIYVPKHAFGDFNHKDCEKGTIKSWTPYGVFVQYKALSALTDFSDLHWPIQQEPPLTQTEKINAEKRILEFMRKNMKLLSVAEDGSMIFRFNPMT
jgi:hypothetical protein